MLSLSQGISEGKITLYTAAAGVNPHQCLPVCLDVGTNNDVYLNDPSYPGLRQKRLSGDDYYSFVDEFFSAVREWRPHVLVQCEDFANHSAFDILDKYRDVQPVFNDDIQVRLGVGVGVGVGIWGVGVGADDGGTFATTAALRPAHRDQAGVAELGYKHHTRHHLGLACLARRARRASRSRGSWPPCASRASPSGSRRSCSTVRARPASALATSSPSASPATRASPFTRHAPGASSWTLR